MEHGTDLRLRKMGEISKAAAVARSTLHRKVRQLRASTVQCSEPALPDKSRHTLSISGHNNTAESSEPPMADKSASFVQDIKRSPSGFHLELMRSSSAKSTQLVVGQCLANLLSYYMEVFGPQKSCCLKLVLVKKIIELLLTKCLCMLQRSLSYPRLVIWSMFLLLGGV